MAVGKGEFSHGRIEGCKELVFDEDSSIRQTVEECGLAGICVSNNRENGLPRFSSALASGCARLARVLQLSLDLAYSIEDAPAVGLEFGLAGTTRPDSRTETAQLHSFASKTG